MIPSRLCAICGRRIEWRRKWANCWDAVTRCSARCRRRRLDATDRALEQALLALVPNRGQSAAVELAEADAGVGRSRERTRDAARRLAARGAVELIVRGRVVDPSRASGPLHLRRRS